MKVLPSISVIIPVFNQAHFTERCLRSLLKHSIGVNEVFVVNNASQDNTLNIIETLLPEFNCSGIKLEVIQNSENYGFGRACNQGIRKCSGERIVILNNDTWLMPNWDQALESKMNEMHWDCIGPYYCEDPFTTEEVFLERAKVFISKNGNRTRNHFVPILIMMTRDAYEVLKYDDGALFDERYFVTYEDADLKFRMIQAGLVFGQTGACFIWHHSMGSRKNVLPTGYEQEGHRIFLEKWGFDPRTHDHTLAGKLRRKWWKWKEKHGFF